MPVIMTARTDKLAVETLMKEFDFGEPAAAMKKKFVHKNFADLFYETEVNGKKLFALFGGYGYNQALGVSLVYDDLIEFDGKPFIVYFGCCQATCSSEAEPGDLVVPSRAYSDDPSFIELCGICRDNNVPGNPELFDEGLSEKMKQVARGMGLKVHGGEVYSRYGLKPGRFKEHPFELWDELWDSFAENEGPSVYGDYETACLVASAHLIRVPSVTVSYVTEKGSERKKDYTRLTKEDYRETLSNITKVIHEFMKIEI
ncbi:MAG: hypothetical protein KAW41_06710 [Candidatus Diapherotrites archaeon]|nr:hypothetical protein [Candidatus Diapherotrites archaeon]